MKNAILFCALILLSCVNAYTSKANSAAAGAIIYSWLSDSTYRVVFKLYNDCKGNPAPDSVSLCVFNSCTSNGFTTTMYKLAGNFDNSTTPNGTEMPLGCNHKQASRCANVTSVLPGIRQWWYVDTVTLPSRCNSWKFRVALNARNASGNIAAGNFAVETSFNNQLSLQNSSPDFITAPAVFVCMNQPYSVNLDMNDADNDSLDYVIVNTQTTPNLNCGTAPANIGLKNMTPPINFISNPIQTNNSFSMNNTTGQMNFTATSPYEQTLTLRVDEYRGGTLIGSINTDVQVYAFKCSTIVPLLDTSKFNATDSVVGGSLRQFYGGGFNGCVGTQVDYYFSIRHPDTTSELVLTDNIQTSLPGAIVTYFAQGTDSVGVHVSLLPGVNDAGFHSAMLTITDTACRPPIGKLQYARAMDIYIINSVSLGNDTAICSHESIRLVPKGTFTDTSAKFLWQMLPGSSGSLLCSNCPVAYGNPAPTATYVVTASSGWCASTYTDTITVTELSTPVTYPTVNITVAPDSNIWQWLQATFTANVNNCGTPSFQWVKNGKDIPGATSSTYSSTELIDNDIISCRFSCNDSCPNPRDTMSNAIKMNVAMSVGKFAVDNTDVSVYPNPANSILHIDIAPLQDVGNYNVVITDMLGRVMDRSLLQAKSNTLDISKLSPAVYIVKIYADGRLLSVTPTVKK